MNILKDEKQEMIISALVEGSSIRSIERMTGVHRDTIMRLLNKSGDSCEKIMDTEMRHLSCKNIEVDEVWSFVGKKQRHVGRNDNPDEVGDFYTFVAIDSESKLVPVYKVGKRDVFTAQAFISDLASRLDNRIQLSSDKLKAYAEAVEVGFGGDVDYGQIVKSYEAEPIGPGRYSPPKVISTTKEYIVGNPNPNKICTSYVERQNLTVRMQVRRFTRLTNAFSKKLDNMKAAVALHYAHYNFVRIHGTLRITPAMAAGITNKLWSISDLLEAN
ncbi:MAG TPA: IS1 family transposase [Syntrophales bacterium]|nr:IS1 family transposase [Syntrophales bacterium]